MKKWNVYNGSDETLPEVRFEDGSKWGGSSFVFLKRAGFDTPELMVLYLHYSLNGKVKEWKGLLYDHTGFVPSYTIKIGDAWMPIDFEEKDWTMYNGSDETLPEVKGDYGISLPVLFKRANDFSFEYTLFYLMVYRKNHKRWLGFYNHPNGATPSYIPIVGDSWILVDFPINL